MEEIAYTSRRCWSVTVSQQRRGGSRKQEKVHQTKSTKSPPGSSELWRSSDRQMLEGSSDRQIVLIHS